MPLNALEQLCYLQGVALDYVDYYGHEKRIDDAVRLAVLKACGHKVDDEDYVSAQNFKLDGATWLQPLAPFQVTKCDAPRLTIRTDVQAPNVLCFIELAVAGQIVHQQNVDVNLCEVSGNYVIGDTRYFEYLITLPPLTPNYYDVNVQLVNNAECVYTACLVVAPTKSYTLEQQQRVWGISCQLYTLCDKRQNGFGDFSSLKELIQRSSECGADYILLNPLHKLQLEYPENASPYSPSDRNQINPLYISPRLCVDHTLVNGEYQQQNNFINYSDVVSHKMTYFKAMYISFCEHELVQNSERAQAFHLFAAQHTEWHLSQFDYYLQWVAFEQLSYCQRYAKQKGMKIGLILDLAVGCIKQGEEYTRHKTLFASGASIGAPPDPWALEGQDWGLAVVDPVTLKNQKFSHFISLLRANMQKGGGLRIDHVMALLRVWWCLEVNEKKAGSYVYYPFSELLAILKLESHLNECVIIGEDLGVVPPEIKCELDKAGIYGNDIFYFAKDSRGDFLAPSEQRKHAMMMIANHDVAPFFAWWQAHDIATRAAYQLYRDPAQKDHDIAQREADKIALAQFVAEQQDISVQDTSLQMYCALVLKLATSNAQFLCLQLDDLSQEINPVNIPGTDREYPNWRRRLSSSLADIFSRFGELNAKSQPHNVSFWQLLNARRKHGTH